jgi:hypothetical protein
MGEWITGAVSGSGEKSSVVIVLSGRTSRRCIEQLKVLLRKWARRCGLGVGGVKVIKGKGLKRKKRK